MIPISELAKLGSYIYGNTALSDSNIVLMNVMLATLAGLIAFDIYAIKKSGSKGYSEGAD